MSLRLEDYSVNYAIGYSQVLLKLLGQESARQLERVLRFARTVAQEERRDGIPLGAFYSNRYRRELEYPQDAESAVAKTQPAP